MEAYGENEKIVDEKIKTLKSELLEKFKLN